ncbi:hypothetical protein FP2506_10516 [Fulvimarina pelagi HTCC2506]|uniref:DUF1223 domain-containing protein n=2 Tax=Fulvimarina pelagi TaxID=217511 RepID=Q0G4Z3_9HYPH|nr:hypothetical protein FP2506_10516 [Fulvimarina pelagi HTCC2506]
MHVSGILESVEIARSKVKHTARTPVSISMLALMLTLTGPGRAEGIDQTIASTKVDHVVELFTSQGCSSCPQAETVLSKLSEEADVLALAYHVDYWDYIGWRDTYGSSQNTARQQAYGKRFNLSTLFTPQMVIDGQQQMVGAEYESVAEVLDDLGPIGSGGSASLSARIAGDNLKIRASMKEPVDNGSLPVLIVVTYDKSSKTQITQGENLGETLTETNPVRDWRILSAWSGEPMKISLPISTLTNGASGENGCAVFIQVMSRTGEPGPILSAARVDLDQ